MGTDKHRLKPKESFSQACAASALCADSSRRLDATAHFDFALRFA
jgi:hypothetical protein